MDRQIEAEVEVRAPVPRAAQVLVDAQEAVVGRRAPGSSGRFLSEVPLDFHGGTSVHQQVEVALSPLDDVRDGGFAFELRWFPTRSRAFPAFAGLLEGWETEGRTMLRLSGAYHPPFGQAGAIGDAVFGKRVATAGIRAFLAELAARLDAEVDRRHAAAPAPADRVIDLRPFEPAESWLG
jgi:hypothetical protein